MGTRLKISYQVQLVSDKVRGKEGALYTSDYLDIPLFSFNQYLLSNTIAQSVETLKEVLKKEEEK